MARQSMSEEEFKQHQKMKRLEAEAQEEVRQALSKQREAKMKAMRAAEPQKPKEITVIAGDGKQVKIQLGGDAQEDSRKQVAEAAGLKHVPLPDFDDSDSSAWAGSLKKTAKTKIMAGRGAGNHPSYFNIIIHVLHLQRRMRMRTHGRDLCDM